MTAIRNGIKCILRTPLKTLLFSAVLVLLSALLTVALCVFSAVRTYLSDCETYFHTIAKLEYIGASYPDGSVHDPALADAVTENAEALDALLGMDGVLYYEPDSNATALIKGISRWDKYVKEPHRAVLRISNPVYDPSHDYYTAIVYDTFYARTNYTNTVIVVRGDESFRDGSFPLAWGKSFYAVGSFIPAKSGISWFQQEDTLFTDETGTTLLPALTETDPDDPLMDAYRRYAAQLRLVNDGYRLQYTAAVEDDPLFQQQILAVSEGRLFTAEEYAARAPVCIVSTQAAGTTGLRLGDRIDLSVYRSNSDLYDPNTWQKADEGGYEIVGLFTGADEKAYRIYLPDARAASRSIAPATGYQLGCVRLRNDRAGAFLQMAEPLVEKGFRVTVYDQGYAAATEPMQELMLISLVFLGICLLLLVAALALQSHLFVSRQRETALTMYALGSGKAHVLLYFLSSAVLMVLMGSAFGCGVAKLLEQRVFEILRRFAEQFARQDLRFSDTRLTLVRTLAFAPSTPWLVYVVSAASMLLGSVLFTAAFALRSLRSEGAAPRKKRRAVLQKVNTRARRSSRLSGPLKYAILSIRRGVVRTVAVVLLCLIVAVFFGQLTASMDGYRRQLEVYRKNAVISGFATDITGQLSDGLVVSGRSLKAFLNADLLSSHTVTNTVASCLALGVAEKADGSACVPPTYAIPREDTYSYEVLRYNISMGIRWVNTNSVSDSPVLHYAKTKDVRWLDGYSDASFADGSASIGALPQSFLEENGLQLGDTVRFLADYYGIWMADVTIVAAYASAEATPILYSPLACLPKNAEDNWKVQSMVDKVARGLDFNTCDSFRFTLRRVDDLDALRQALADAGFTYVHSGVRGQPFVIIEDEMYLNTTHSMERQIQYVSVLYDSLYVIAGVIGFVLAWLLAQSRRREIAVMRALGTPPVRILANFLAEQVLLSASGMLLGIAVSYLAGSPVKPFFLILCGAFWGVWNAATLLCLLAGSGQPSYASLAEPE